MLKITVFALFTLCFFLSSEAQIIEKIEPSYISTIQFKGNTDQSQLPIISLGESIQMTFDALNGEEEDFYYKITHHDFDWSESDLSKGEYLDGFDDVRIEDYQNSLNTLQLFSNYSLRIPNRETRALKKSGNYLISVYDEDGELVFTRRFMIMERRVGIAVEIKRSRDLKYINEKQSVNFTINSADLIIINPKQNLNVLVLQNSNLKTAITDLKPQYTIGNELIYRYDQESAFYAGNEFNFFDSKELRGANNSIRRVELNDLYEHFLFTRRARYDVPYTYNPDINGNFVVRSIRAERQNIEAEYILTHFALQYFEDIEDKEIHIYGSFNDWGIDESTYMQYDEKRDVYTTSRKFKQGFYNYRFVLVDREGNIDEGAIGGNYWETENDYTVLAYYRAPGERYDRIIGQGKGNSTVITNN